MISHFTDGKLRHQEHKLFARSYMVNKWVELAFKSQVSKVHPLHHFALLSLHKP